MKTPNDEMIGSEIKVSLGLIDFDPKNRKEHDKAKLQSLADSIKAEGLLEPLVVRSVAGGRFRLIAGERRLRALQINKAESAPVRVVQNDTDDSAARKRLVENLQREDLTPIEEARGYRELAVDFKMTQKAIADLAGVAQPTVGNALRLLDLPGSVQQLVQDGKLTRAHGIALASWSKWAKICEAMADLVFKKGANSKLIESEDLPFSYELVRMKLVEEIDCYGYPAPKYTVPAAMQKDPDFIKSYSTWYCLTPAKWVPEKARQDQARVAKESADKKKEAAAVKSGGKTKEQLERAKIIAKNKAARSKIAEGLSTVTARLKAGKAKDIELAAALVCQKVGLRGGDLRESAGKLGVKLPGKFDAYQAESWTAISVGDSLRLVAQLICASRAAEQLRHAGAVPDEIEFLLPKGGRK